jgi:hypothetical protein
LVFTAFAKAVLFPPKTVVLVVVSLLRPIKAKSAYCCLKCFLLKMYFMRYMQAL